MSREKTVEIRKVRIEGIIIQKPGKIKKPPNQRSDGWLWRGSGLGRSCTTEPVIPEKQGAAGAPCIPEINVLSERAASL